MQFTAGACTWLRLQSALDYSLHCTGDYRYSIEKEGSTGGCKQILCYYCMQCKCLVLGSRATGT